jgi:hypothetical protein
MVKIAVNKQSIGFDDVENAEEPVVAQVLEITEAQASGAERIPLRFVRFQKVDSLHVCPP